MITALTEKAERPKSETLKFNAQTPLDEALVYIIFSVQDKTNSFKGEGARLHIIKHNKIVTSKKKHCLLIIKQWWYL